MFMNCAGTLKLWLLQINLLSQTSCLKRIIFDFFRSRLLVNHDKGAWRCQVVEHFFLLIVNPVWKQFVWIKSLWWNSWLQMLLVKWVHHICWWCYLCWGTKGYILIGRWSWIVMLIKSKIITTFFAFPSILLADSQTQLSKWGLQTILLICFLVSTLSLHCFDLVVVDWNVSMWLLALVIPAQSLILRH